VNDEQDHIVDELITKYLAGEASAEEENRLLAWIALTPENERHFLGFKKVFDVSQKHYAQEADGHPVNLDQEWNHFVRQINASKEKTIRLQPPPSSRTWLRIAAAILLLLASGMVINYFVLRNGETQYRTADNSLTVSLPDGSHVILNRNSALSYSRNYGEEKRTVTLKGEGFFEVAHDANKPFVIQVNGANIEVLGTSFNVQGYDSRTAIEVIVQTGVVKFSVPELQQEVKLVAGQRGVYSKGNQQLTRAPNADVNFLSWNTRKLVFMENDLRAVVETLNNTYHAEIVLATDIPASCVVTVTFDHQTLDAVLHVLETTLNLTYRKTGHRIEIIRAGC